MVQHMVVLMVNGMAYGSADGEWHDMIVLVVNGMAYGCAGGELYGI